MYLNKVGKRFPGQRIWLPIVVEEVEVHTFHEAISTDCPDCDTWICSYNKEYD